MALSRPNPSSLFTSKNARANCVAADTVGKCVYVSADKVGDLYQVRTVDPSTYAKMPAVGVIASKSSDTECVVHMIGPLDDVYSGLDVGRVMFVDDDGDLNKTPPVPPPGESRFVQAMGSTLGSSSVLLIPNFSMVKLNG